ncbi:DUF3418 domain-containing protein [Actinobaculum suis]|uniref:DUF3418 domain-containing protein n=1 Tax=Actinobaculum suis TaxID=1657 RepID=UPI000ACCFA5C|nr:DUF3418 domain-containing protein [Actinobaculum suis]
MTHESDLSGERPARRNMQTSQNPRDQRPRDQSRSGQKSGRPGQRRRKARGKGQSSGQGQARRPRVPRAFSPQEIAARRASLPEITYPAELPVSARREEIKQAIAENQVVIVAGETGSGKTTQLPKICLELGRGVEKMIGHTQPRRIAARSVAERIAHELGQKVGQTIGFQVRFTEEVSRETLVKLMTDGILLNEIQSDPQLLRYDTLIIDEAHERSLNIDFILGYLARLLPQRPDLKVIITSATIDTRRFAEHFGQHQYRGKAGELAPIVEVSGRTYPVEIRYRPLAPEDELTPAPEHDAVHTGTDRTTGNAANRSASGVGPAPTAATPAVNKPATPGRADAKDQVTGIIEAAEELLAEGPGDILVFLSGEGEIRDTVRAFQDEFGPKYVAPGEKSSVPGAVEVLPLFGRMSNQEQNRIFHPGPLPRIILATNIAETSITVPRIKYVIDPGTARISRYSNKTKVQRLPIEPISQASANQRSGRCGRVEDGIAIRLYSEVDFQARPEFTQPEIQRTSLASVILQMLSLNLGSVEEFPFIDPPERQAVAAGVQLLEEIDAITPASRGGQRKLTKVGHRLARLPIDPRLGRMLIEAESNGCASEVLVIVAALSVQDVRERPTEKRQAADQYHARFNAASSDFLSYLTLWRYLRTQQRELSGAAFRRLMRAEFLNYLRFREWCDVVNQLEEMCRPLGIRIRRLALPSPAEIQEAITNDLGAGNPGGTPQAAAVAEACRTLGRSADTPEAGAIHRSLLVGLLSNIGNYRERTRDYAGARGTHFVIWPGSGLHRRTPAWVMAAELVETSRLFARTVAAIKPEWVEPAAKNLVRRSYSDPYWSSRAGAAMCKEKVTLYGLTLIADRPVLLSKTGTPGGRELARSMFIEHALVEGDWRGRHDFQDRNQEALAQAYETESKLRQHGLVADESARAKFYAERIPQHVVSAGHFNSWWKKARQENEHLLDFTQEFLLGGQSAAADDYPGQWQQGELTFPLEYSFSPDSYADGITVEIPVSVLPQVTEAGFDWLVPGMLDELVIGTIRGLPKRVRRQLVPAPDTAREILPLLPAWEDVAHGQADAPSFREAFTQAALRLRGVEIDDAAWAELDLPEHLRMHFRIVSERGAVLEEGSSLEKLKHDLAPQSQHAVETVVAGAVAQALDEARRSLPVATQSEEPLTQWPTPSSASDASATLSSATGASATPSSASDASATLSSATGASATPSSASDASAADSLAADGKLPLVLETAGPHGTVVRAYPALADREGKVYLDVVASPGEQVRVHRGGVIRLAANTLALPEARITSRWDGETSLLLAASPAASTSALVADLQWAATRNLALRWAKSQDLTVADIRSGSQFTELTLWARDEFEDEVFLLAQGAAQATQAWAEVEKLIRESSSVALLATVADEREHMNTLMPPNFVAATPPERFWDLPRYLQATKYRIEKAQYNPLGDDSLAWQVQEAREAIARARQKLEYQEYSPRAARILEEAEWMVEELRVSLFAQQLGTKGKVSVKRIERKLAELETEER